MKDYTPDYIKINKARTIGELVSTLDLTKEEDIKTYKAERYKLIELCERKECQAYLDSKNKITVGIGFNMQSSGARKEWEEAFKVLKPRDRPNFDAVYKGTRSLNTREVKILCNYSLNAREKRVQYLYRKIWDKLTPNEKLAIEDAFFNAEQKLVGIPYIRDKDGNILYDKNGNHLTRKTNFYKQMHLYIEAKEQGDYEKALLHFNYARWELKYNSNREKDIGAKNRRDSQEAMLDTYKDEILQESEIKEKLSRLKAVRKEESVLDPRGKAFLSIVIGGSIAIAGYNFFTQRALERCRNLMFLQFQGKGFSTCLQIENTITGALYKSGAYHKDKEKYFKDKQDIINLAEETWDKVMRKSAGQNT